MHKDDQRLGMNRSISRRDLLHDGGVATLASMLAGPALADTAAGNKVSKPMPADYPPVRTGLRGSHPGSFEAAHVLRDGGQFQALKDDPDTYDLVIVGGGISGLTAAIYYQDRFGADARILIVENHDDFGGHAKRNEFHQAGTMRLSMGGTHNLEPWQFSANVNKFLKRLGIDIEDLRANKEFNYGFDAANGTSIWFDKETYGEDRLVTNYTLESWTPKQSLACIDEFPLSAAAKKQLQGLFRTDVNVLEDYDGDVQAYLASISYPEFLQRHAGAGAEAIGIFNKTMHGAWGVELRAMSAREALGAGMPGLGLIGMQAHMAEREYPVAMFPDGNASIARLLVHRLIPEVAPGTDVHNVALANFDYAKLDKPDHPVRLRLGATVLNARNTDRGAAITYMHDGALRRVTSKHCVMACYHSILPYLCPDLPAAQRQAQSYQVKLPLLLTNVLLKSSEAMDKLGIDQVYCPGRMHSSMFMFKGINTGGYQHPMHDKGAVPLVFWGSISPPPDAVDAKAQFRASRQKMLELSFEDYEREVRTVLHGLLGPVGFKVDEDILAITVNRWPHGYAYGYMDLWDEKFATGQTPHERARAPFGNITFANSDAAASAYTHDAIDQAKRAVDELG